MWDKKKKIMSIVHPFCYKIPMNKLSRLISKETGISCVDNRLQSWVTILSYSEENVVKYYISEYFIRLFNYGKDLTHLTSSSKSIYILR